MHLYDCRFGTFIQKATSGQIAHLLQERFIDRLDAHPAESEVRSWKNSLGAFAESISAIGIDKSWIVLEYQLPLSSSRIDCMVLGSDKKKQENVVLLEFKQWDSCNATDASENIRVGGVEHLHPSAQVRAYHQYLEDAHSAFEDGHIKLASCAYLHNVKSELKSHFFDLRYSTILKDSPAFSAENVAELSEFLNKRIRGGASARLVDSLLTGQYKPSKKLLDHVADSIEKYEPWKLLDEQRVVFNRIIADVETARRKKSKKVIIVLGGPGTGKSVIAVQVLGVAARRGYNAVHATGSKAFTTNLRGIVGRNESFLYTHNFIDAPKNGLDLIVCDEAHRLRLRTQFGPRILSRNPQAEELIDAAKVAVFFLDGQQSVRVAEVGSLQHITNYTKDKNIDVSVYDLKTQFRCAGSESYVKWIDAVLGLAESNSLAWWRHTEYEVRTMGSPAELEKALRQKTKQGFSARMVAGFDWPWSDPRKNGSLARDVHIGSWSRPWNRKPRDMWKVNKGSAENPSKHPYKIWATEPEAFEQIGCIYSAQGFEFDYVGVIFGSDLRWDSKMSQWLPDLNENCDQQFKMGLTKNPDLALEKLKHLYRVLCTRGMRGTYLYFLDPSTKRHFERMMEKA